MPNQPEGNGRSGRSVALPDENRPSWRPQDETLRNRRALGDEDERYEDDRWRHWDERERRDWDARGGGQSGYNVGRYPDDRSGGYQSRNQAYPGAFEDRYRERGTDDRFTGRGGSAYYERGYNPERQGAQGGYGGGRGWEAERLGPRGYGDQEPRDRPSHNLGTGGTMRREHTQGSTGYHGGEAPSGHRGKGPMNYQRSDERVRELVCEALTEDDRVDASAIEVAVKNGEVTLTGNVPDRQMKRIAEDVAEGISGVRELQNQLRVGGEKPRAPESERSRHRA